MSVIGGIFWAALTLIAAGLSATLVNQKKLAAVLIVVGTFGVGFALWKGEDRPSIPTGSTISSTNQSGGVTAQNVIINGANVSGSQAPTQTAAKPMGLSIHCQMTSLPSTIAPHSKLYMLWAQPENPKFLSVIPNNGEEPLKYLETSELEALNFLMSVYLCEVHNPQKVAVQNVEMVFPVGFYPMKPGDFGPDSRISGPLASSHGHQVVIGSIDAQSTFDFYIANRGDFFSQIDFPTIATLELPGDNRRREAMITREKGDWFDPFPIMLAPPRTPSSASAK